MRVELHPEARAEVRAAALWYDDRRPGLAEDFLAEVTATLERIGEAPAQFPLWPQVAHAPRPIRRAVLRRFPYVVAFEAHADHLLVLAIAHAKRRPLYWFSRVS